MGWFGTGGPSRRARWVLPAALLLATTACSTSTSGADPVATPLPPESSPTADASTDSTPAPDESHVVPAPGPLTDRLLGPDLLVYSPDPLSADMVDQISGIPGVTNVESMSMAQVSVEGKVINVAAVDPASYRRYTRVNSAQLEEEWQRVAGGELAIVPAIGKKLIGPDGYVRLGNEASAPRIHVGAYAPQIPQVDAVVNEKWAATLGMRMGNALVVATGITSPQSVRSPIEKIAGDRASVQILGPDLDISVQQTAFVVGTVADAVGTFNYRVLSGGRIAPDPAWVTSHITTEAVPILGNVTCNRLLFPQLRGALEEVVNDGLADKIHPGEYAGCYNARFIAGTTKLSNHSFGLALDLNVPGNQRGTVGEMDRRVVDIFKRWGFAWGGDWHYTDPMHFEMNALVQPR